MIAALWAKPAKSKTHTWQILNQPAFTIGSKLKRIGDGKPVENEFKDGKLTIHLPALYRTKLPDVVAVKLGL